MATGQGSLKPPQSMSNRERVGALLSAAQRHRAQWTVSHLGNSLEDKDDQQR